MIHFRLRYERLRERLRLVARSAALARALCAGVVVGGTGAVVAAFDPAGPWRLWPWAAAATAVGAGVLLDRRARRAPIDAMLDRRLALDDLIVTAVEVDRRGPRNPLEVRLLDDAASTLAGLGGERAVSWRPVVVELEQLAGAGILALGLLLLAHVRGVAVLPDRLPAVPGLLGLGGGAGAGDGGRAPGAGTGAGPSAAQRGVAAALADQAAAVGAANALRRGDEAGAARALRALADEAPRLSEAGRDGLRDALEDAAERAGPFDPELGRALQSAARDLGSPDADRVARALEELATRVEGGAGRAVATEPLASRDEGGRAGRLPGGSAELDLERAPGGGAGRRAEGASVADSAADAAASRPSTAPDGAGTTRGDPAAVPLGERDLVRRYFAPGAPAVAVEGRDEGGGAP